MRENAFPFSGRKGFASVVYFAGVFRNSCFFVFFPWDVKEGGVFLSNISL